MPRVLTIAEGNTRPSANGLDGKVRRSPQAVACGKRYVVELERSHEFPAGRRQQWIRSSRVRRGVIKENPRKPSGRAAWMSPPDRVGEPSLGK